MMMLMLMETMQNHLYVKVMGYSMMLKEMMMFQNLKMIEAFE
jgi:hypothetical protein